MRQTFLHQNVIHSICLQINVGCTTDSSSLNPVHLEFSRDFGATWHLLVPLCAGGPRLSSLCSTELHPASIYYPGTTQGWRREVIHFGKLRLCGWVQQPKKHPFCVVPSCFRQCVNVFHSSVRFRWYQGFYSGGMSPPTWALDSVYIGPQCQNMCNGHGACVQGTHCNCDPGYSGPDCSVPDMPNPDFLKEDFEGNDT